MALRGGAKTGPRALKNEVGNKHGLLTAVAIVRRNGRLRYECICDCGGRNEVDGRMLRKGLVRSCGCLMHPKKHGRHGTRAYNSWHAMLQRCRNPQCKDFNRYGGRGIKFDPRWVNFEDFYADMGDPPDGATLDRIDVNGNYEKANCRWANATVQANNRRATLSRVIANVDAVISGVICEPHLYSADEVVRLLRSLRFKLCGDV